MYRNDRHDHEPQTPSFFSETNLGKIEEMEVH